MFVPLFYYRSFVLLPKNHFINQYFLLKWWNWIFLIGIYPFISLVPLPFFYLINMVNDNRDLKEAAYQMYKCEFTDYFSDDVLAIDTSLANFGILYALITLFLATFASGLVVIASCVYIYYVLNRTTRLSIRNRNQHKMIFTSIVSMVR